MAKEVLNLEVKSNIKSVTKDTDKLAESIEDINQEAKESIGNFTLMGVSLNGVKAAFAKVIPMAKAMFGTIKAGLISTGIGALVVAFGTLAAWFTKTKKGAEVLSVVFKGVGAAVSVIIDRIAKFGGGIAKILSGNVRSGLKDMGDTFKGIGTEILTDTLHAMELEKQLQRLVDRERDLSVETVQRRAEIEQLKMIAEDVTKSEEERLAAAEKAFKIETDLLEKRIENAEEAVRIEEARLSDILDPTAEALDLLAQKEIDLATIQGESATKQIELNNKINAIKQTTITLNEQLRLDAEAELQTTQDMLRTLQLLRIEDEHDKALKRLENERDDQLADAKKIKGVEAREARIKVINETFQEKYFDLLDKNRLVTITESKKTAVESSKWSKYLAERQMEWSKMSTDAKLDHIHQVAGTFAKAAGEQTAAGKAFAIIQATIDTYKGATAAFSSMAGIPYVGPVLGGIAAAAAIASGLKNVQAISSAGGGGGGGGGSTPSTPAAPPSPQMMSGAFELTGGQEVEPARAYVVSDDITNNQNKLAIIRRRATI